MDDAHQTEVRWRSFKIADKETLIGTTDFGTFKEADDFRKTWFGEGCKVVECYTYPAVYPLEEFKP